MRVLIACEFSGIVRDEFKRRGRDAWSCDLLPTERPGNHLQCDVFEAISQYGPWDLIILHPPCTAISLSGNKHYGRGCPKHDQRIRSLQWTAGLVHLARQCCGRVVVEQPASTLCQKLGKRTQEIHPWMFGHKEQKKTWLWLYGVPPLKPTDNVYDAMMLLPKKERERIFYMGKKPSRGKDRSVTYTGIAAAMADQWGAL